MEGQSKKVPIPQCYDFDYNIGLTTCAMPECLVGCVYYNGGQEAPGQWMRCKVGQGAFFCSEHRDHEVHQGMDCGLDEEKDEEEIVD